MIVDKDPMQEEFKEDQEGDADLDKMVKLVELNKLVQKANPLHQNYFACRRSSIWIGKKY